MDKNIEQRICLKFCIANGISCAESLKMLQKIYGKSTLSKTRAYEWYNAFKSGRDEVKDLPRSGRPSTSLTENNIAKVKELVTENSNLSLREIAAELSMSHESIRTILNNFLGKKLTPSGSTVQTKQKRASGTLDLADAPPAKKSATKVTKPKTSQSKSSPKAKKSKPSVRKTVGAKNAPAKKRTTSPKKSPKPKPTATKAKTVTGSRPKKAKVKQKGVTGKAKSSKKPTSSKKK